MCKFVIFVPFQTLDTICDKKDLDNLFTLQQLIIDGGNNTCLLRASTRNHFSKLLDLLMEFVRNPQSSNMMNVLYQWFFGIGNGSAQA